MISSKVERDAYNIKVEGSNPSSNPRYNPKGGGSGGIVRRIWVRIIKIAS